jgi:drug/metabolite transporter (DMT)-like permease
MVGVMTAPYDSTVITGNERGRAHAGGRPLLPVAVGATLISASAILVKLAGTGAATTAFYRCALAVPVLAALLVVEQRRLGPRPRAGHLWAMLAGLFLAVDFVLWNHAIAAVGAGIATVLGNLQVLFVALAAWLAFGERPQRRFLVALPVVMAGVVLVSGLLGSLGSTTDPVGGIGYGIGTSVAYAGFILVLRKTSGGTPHVAGPLAEATVSAAAGALILGLMFGGFQLTIGWPSFGWLLLLAISSQTIAWLLITSSLPKLPASITSLMLLLQPAAALVLAAIVLGERPSLLQLAGAVLVCCGVLAASRAAATGRGPEAAAPEAPAPEPLPADALIPSP